MEILAPINDLIKQYLGEFGPLIVVGVLGLIMIVIAVTLMLKQPEDPLKKLQKSTAAPKSDKNPRRTSFATPAATSSLKNSRRSLSRRTKTSFRQYSSSCVRPGIIRKMLCDSSTLRNSHWVLLAFWSVSCW